MPSNYDRRVRTASSILHTLVNHISMDSAGAATQKYKVTVLITKCPTEEQKESTPEQKAGSTDEFEAAINIRDLRDLILQTVQDVVDFLASGEESSDSSESEAEEESPLVDG